MKMGKALKLAAVAHQTLETLGRKSTVLPGFLSKLLVYSIGPLPRWMKVRIMGRVMQRMMEHGKKEKA